MSNCYTEDQLVEQPAIGLFDHLGWETVSAAEETFGVSGTLGRLAKTEAVLSGRLRAALVKLNPTLPPEAITSAMDELTRNRSAMSMAAANREVHELLKQGIKVSVPDKERGGQKPERVRVIEWETPKENDFLLVSQMSIQGPLYLRRPDLIGFVNGLPLVVVELKKPGVPAQQAFTDNLTCYKADIPALFWGNALMIASNGTDSRVGSLTADWERFFEWKRIASEDEPRRVSLEVMIRGTCDKTRLLDLVENFILFSEHKAGLVKIVGQNHQFLGVNNAIGASLKARTEGHGRGGVFWQTQGSGKSFSMVFYSQKILRTVPGDWTFVIVTDRVELDEQIATTFKACGAVSEAEGEICHASSGEHLRELLRGNHRYSEQPCGKRLKPMLAAWLPYYERRYGDLGSEVREIVLAISAAQIDRLLAPGKIGAGMVNRRTPKTNAAVKALVEIRAECWDAKEPGWIEADTVAHCGGDMGGSFLWSLTATDVFSGWTEVRASWNRGQQNVCSAFTEIEEALPFAMLGVDTDNGGEFLNYHLHRHFTGREKPVKMTRSRPYHKNDQAHVEQKNSTHVRQLLGFDRLGNDQVVPLVTQLLEAWSIWRNGFTTSFKQTSKQRIGSKTVRRHEKVPKTPCERLIDHAEAIARAMVCISE